MKKENLFDSLYNDDGSINKENWVTPDDIVEFVKEELKNGLEEDFKSFDVDKIIGKLKELGIPMIELKFPNEYFREIRIKNFSEYLRYLEIRKPTVLFTYINSVSYSDEEDILHLYYYNEKEFEECGILEKIRKIVKDFVSNYSIMSHQLQIVDEHFVSINYEMKTKIIENLDRDLNLLGDKLKEQKEIIEDIQYDKAMNEVKYLYSYLIINSDFLACKTDKQCKLYKEKGKYLNDDRFKNLKFMIDNKPVINSEKYRKYRMLYIELEDTFERARRFVKGENK